MGTFDTYLKDPIHPYCSFPLYKIAFLLYGGISEKHNRFNPESKQHDYVNFKLSYEHFKKYVMRPSGDVLDVFMHLRVPEKQIQKELTNLYKPILFRFDEDYSSKSLYEYIGNISNTSRTVVSQWHSISKGLRLVKDVEMERGEKYSHIYITRPDVLIWKPVNIRKYCKDVFYFNNCFEPFVPHSCLADFHFVIGSDMKSYFIDILHYFETGQAHFWNGRGSVMGIANFVTNIVRASWSSDHVVVQRHEEILRKKATLYEKEYFQKKAMFKNTQML